MEKLTIHDFDALFSIMEKSFPTDEFRPYDEQKALFSKKRYSVYGEKDGTRLLGFLSVWDFDDFLYVEHFAVDSALRGGGIGSKMLSSLVAAQKRPSCLEVELPENDTARRRIGFYMRNGFFLNEYDYIQPPISKGRLPVPLRIMTSGGRITQADFEKIRTALYKEVYGAPLPTKR